MIKYDNAFLLAFRDRMIWAVLTSKMTYCVCRYGGRLSNESLIFTSDSFSYFQSINYLFIFILFYLFIITNSTFNTEQTRRVIWSIIFLRAHIILSIYRIEYNTIYLQNYISNKIICFFTILSTMIHIICNQLTKVIYYFLFDFE